jgi:Polysaccharide deacetylase.
MITVFFRYDDYSPVSPLDVDSGVINVMQKHNMCCTFAVIPAVKGGDDYHPGDRDEFVLGEEKLELLKNAIHEDVVDLALHGWNHRTHDAALPGAPSEFQGLPFDVQATRIRRGYEFFKQQIGVVPNIFVPPWNTYDVNTLLGLEQIGIGCISADRISPVIKSSLICYAPITVEMDSLRLAIENARTINDPEPIIGVMLHPYNFYESKDSRCFMNLADFECDINWLAHCSDVRVKSIGSLVESGHKLSAKRFLDNRPSNLERIFPPFIKKTYQNPVYMSSLLARRTFRGRVTAMVAFYLTVVVLAYIGGNVMLASLPGINDTIVKTMQYVAALGVVLLLARGALVKAIYFRGMMLLSALNGLLLALTCPPFLYRLL